MERDGRSFPTPGSGRGPLKGPSMLWSGSQRRTPGRWGPGGRVLSSSTGMGKAGARSPARGPARPRGSVGSPLSRQTTSGRWGPGGRVLSSSTGMGRAGAWSRHRPSRCLRRAARSIRSPDPPLQMSGPSGRLPPLAPWPATEPSSSSTGMETPGTSSSDRTAATGVT